MLNINDLVIKLFLDLYLVSIYVKYVYMRVHIFIMYIHVNACEYLFLCFTCYLGLTMNVGFCLSPILRHIDYIYNCSPFDIDVP